MANKNFKNINNNPTKVIPTLPKIVLKHLKATDLKEVKAINVNFDNVHVILNIPRKMVLFVNKDLFMKEIAKYSSHPVLDITYDGDKKIRMCKITTRVKPQFLAWFNTLSSYISAILSKRHLLTNPDVGLFLMDIVRLLIDVRDGYLTGSKIITTLMSLYTMYMRFTRGFKPQGMALHDIVLLLAPLGLPQHLTTKLKDIVMLTGRKIFDFTYVMDLLETLEQVVVFMIDNMIKFSPNPIFLSMKQGINYIFSSVGDYRLINKICEVCASYAKDPQMIFNIKNREMIKELKQQCNNSKTFLDSIANSTNKYTNIAWKTFSDSICKFVNTFESSRRKEPVCVILQGEPGCGKSVIANSLTDLFVHTSRSTYVHTVPPVDGGKDFYDDYLNQDVFIMDDVGQQAISQWRTLINFVSPIKYPLDCANAPLKNTKYFNSELILCTTNNFMNLSGLTKSDGIAELPALFRRAHVFKIEKIENSEVYSQKATYFKYDHVREHKWVNSFTNICSKLDRPTKCTGTSNDVLRYIYHTIVAIEKETNLNSSAMVMDNDVLADIIAHDIPKVKDSEFHDAASCWSKQSWITDYIATINNFFPLKQHVLREWYDMLLAQISTYTGKITEMFINGTWADSALVSLIPLAFAGVVYYVIQWFIGDNVPSFEERPHDIFKNWKEQAKNAKNKVINVRGDFYASPQGDLTYDYAKFSKFIVIKNEDESVHHSHGIVSGTNILLPAHLHCNKARIDVYKTWEHFTAGHKELEEVEIVKKEAFYQCDMAVYTMKDLSFPIYKKCKFLFNKVDTHSAELFLINVGVEVPIIVGQNSFLNKEAVSYSTYKHQHIEHAPNTGYITPLTGAGLCGTMLVSRNQGIIGMHVAGNNESGFCAIPSTVQALRIKELMDEGRDCQYEIDNKIIPDFSGVRLRYSGGDFTPKYPVGKTSFEKTPFHIEVNEETRELIAEVENTDIANSKAVHVKGPPIFKGKEKTVIDNLSAISKKRFKHTGHISAKEREYIRSVLCTYMIEYGDLSDEQTTFGGDGIQAINKDSSNGYGNLKNKTDYIDFEEKKHKPIFDNLLKEFKGKCESDTLEIGDVLNIETFKDELRAQEKRGEPRTFNVTPLAHIWWTKKIFGSLMKHFMETRHNTGIAVGFNPYVDMDVLARKLQTCEVTGDADFKKWDGSISADLMLLVRDVFKEYYKGENSVIIDKLFQTMVRSPLLVFDAVYIPNHGLPSGNWLTLLLNSLINKCLTALTVYRNKPDPRVEDATEIVDYVMGDDKIFGTTKELGQYFNLLTLTTVATSLGMQCTNGDKTPIVKASQPFEKLTFLKRSFKFHPQLKKWMGCLDPDTILNTIQWYDATKEYDEAVEGKIRAMQVESYIHSHAFFLRLTNLARNTEPCFALFSDTQVIKILSDPESYKRVMALAGKDVRFLNA